VANKYKLHHLYGPDTARSMQVHEQALLLADLEAKLDVVDAFLTQDSTS
jgi:hypothetical protein